MKKGMKNNLDSVLNMPVPDKMAGQLRNLGIKEEDITNETAIAVALYQQAIKGNVNAINTINKITDEEQIKREIKKKQNRTRYVKKEVERLNELFENIPTDQKELSKQLIENAGFMSATLEELRATINEKGVKEEYKNGQNQFGYKDSVEVKTYNSMIKNYMSVIKQLSDLLPNGNEELEDEFDRFCDEE